ncbi:MAG: hypothetical protein LBS02_17855 [Hungatella sp.]|jgi:hypothetical protein|nr:hypothetical protein [Hungatella sp.]
MNNIDKFKEYMSLCGIETQKELKEKGGYPKSVQYLGGVLSGKYKFTEDEEKLMYQACNTARAKRLLND